MPMATMIIKPVRAAMGNCSIKGAPNTMNTNNITAATMPLSRARAPELDVDEALANHGASPHPAEQATQHVGRALGHAFPVPLATGACDLVQDVQVSKLSMSPTPATTAAYGKMMVNVSQVTGTSGRWNGGNPP